AACVEQCALLPRWARQAPHRSYPCAATAYRQEPRPEPGSRPGRCCSWAAARAAKRPRSEYETASASCVGFSHGTGLSSPGTRSCARPGISQFLKEVVMGVEEKAQARAELIDVESAPNRPLDVLHPVIKGECEFLQGGRAGFADVVSAD